MVPATTPSSETTNSWRNSRWLIAAELALFAAIFFADLYHWHHIIKISKTLYLFALGWISLRVRGLRWKSLGLRLYHGWVRTLALGALCGAGIEALELFVTQPILVRITHHWPDLSDFRGLRWNWKLLPVAMLLTWTLAAFGEEMVFRGYLMNRVADFFKSTRRGWIISLIVVNVVFGFAHQYQGMTGVIENAIDGFLLGLIYLRCDRSLAVPIVAHGVTDTLDFLLIFVGKYPGM
jgi:membrane protease YdiL (CAAX protease family)